MFMTEKEYRHVLDLMQGKQQPDAVLTGLKAFFAEEFQCEIYDYICDTLEDGRHRLQFVVWSRDEHMRFMTHQDKYFGRDREKEARIKARFSSLCQREGVHSNFHDVNAYFAVATDILSELRSDIQNKARPQIQRYLHSIPEVKRAFYYFHAVHVFYERDDDIAIHETDGLSKVIDQKIYEIKKPFDDFHVCKPGETVFTSIQTLNEKYSGSLYYYWL